MGTDWNNVIQVNNNGEKVMIHFALNEGGTVGVQMDATSAIELAQSLVIHAAVLTKDFKDPKASSFSVPEENKKKTDSKPGFESFMDDVNQSIADATKGLTKPKKK